MAKTDAKSVHERRCCDVVGGYGKLKKTNEIIKGGDEILPTTLPLSKLNNADKLFSWSRDAGTYFCNEVYYRSLHKIRKSLHPLVPVAFIHLPQFERVSQKEQLRRAKLILKEIMTAAHSSSYDSRVELIYQ